MVKATKAVHLEGRRKTIAERLSRSHLSAVHVTITMDADVTELNRLMRESMRQTARKMTYTHFMIKAVALSLRDWPMLNAYLENDTLTLLDEVNIGVAVALDDGLIVPVIRKADKKTQAEIASELDRLANDARDGKLTLAEVTEGPFAVSNLEMVGVDVFTPIINPPQVAILGAGKVAERSVVVRGQIQVRMTMPLSLSFDHRAVDGAIAANFPASLVARLENQSGFLRP
jgi:pyruvate dehydrogenase E2 component (dihydrolipoamide acetyltransferase)